MDNKYVTCGHCGHWDQIRRMGEVCDKCNNSKLVKDPHTLLCNMCGECVCPIGTSNEQYPHGLYNAQVSGGFDSYHLFDCTTYTFSFCELCLRKMFNECKIKPLLSSFLSSQDHLTYEDDLKYYEYRIWKDTGGHHQSYLNRKCNAIKDCPNDAIYTKLERSGDFTEDCCCEDHKDIHTYISTKLVKFIPQNLKAFL